MIEMYCDGGNSMANEVGGCSAIIVKDKSIIAELSEAYEGEHITNNVCELAAVILGLNYILANPQLGKEVKVISDSQYITSGAKNWLPKWKLKGWKTTTGKVKNQVLWEAIDELKSKLNIDWIWTKGHANNNLNNLADELAGKAYRKLIK